jgi:hypothetical protein
LTPYLDQLRTLACRLRETNQALMAWDAIAAQRRLPPGAQRRRIKRPKLSRRALKLQLVLLLADMSRLEQEIFAAPLLSSN